MGTLITSSESLDSSFFSVSRMIHVARGRRRNSVVNRQRFALSSLHPFKFLFDRILLLLTFRQRSSATPALRVSRELMHLMGTTYDSTFALLPIRWLKSLCFCPASASKFEPPSPPPMAVCELPPPNPNPLFERYCESQLDSRGRMDFLDLLMPT